jgi:hypothetical protein
MQCVRPRCPGSTYALRKLQVTRRDPSIDDAVKRRRKSCSSATRAADTFPKQQTMHASSERESPTIGSDALATRRDADRLFVDCKRCARTPSRSGRKSRLLTIRADAVLLPLRHAAILCQRCHSRGVRQWLAGIDVGADAQRSRRCAGPSLRHMTHLRLDRRKLQARTRGLITSKFWRAGLGYSAHSARMPSSSTRRPRGRSQDGYAVRAANRAKPLSPRSATLPATVGTGSL